MVSKVEKTEKIEILKIRILFSCAKINTCVNTVNIGQTKHVHTEKSKTKPTTNKTNKQANED